MIYRLYKTSPMSIEANGAYYTNEQGQMISFLFDPANRDFADFKAQINADKAQLENADGNLMTADEAKAFVANLP